MSVLMQIASDIAAKVSAVTLSPAIVAVVDVAPDFDLSQVKARKVIVTPQGYSRSTVTRGESTATAKVSVGLVEKIAIADVNSRIAVIEAIAEALERQSLMYGNVPYAIVTDVEFDPIYDAATLRNSHVFLSICTVTVKVIRCSMRNAT